MWVNRGVLFLFYPPWNSLKIGRNRHATSVSIVEKIKIIKSKQLKASQNQSSFNHHKLISQFKSLQLAGAFSKELVGAGGELKSRTITGSQVSIWHILVRKGCFFWESCHIFSEEKTGKLDLEAIQTWSMFSVVEASWRKAGLHLLEAVFMVVWEKTGEKWDFSVKWVEPRNQQKHWFLCAVPGPGGRGFFWNWQVTF